MRLKTLEGVSNGAQFYAPFDGSSRAPNAIDQPGVCIGDLRAKYFRFASRRTN
jgi:hypothetical protein